ncbi:hypothetical protein KA107_00100 [Candidatus Pacearchaeota archaeon]|nr:hypothetical protein [Candidatus Pacearchaeota archaeon]
MDTSSVRDQNGAEVSKLLAAVANSLNLSEVNLNPCGLLGVMKGFGLRVSPRGSAVMGSTAIGLMQLSGRRSAIYFFGQDDKSPFLDYSYGRTFKAEHIYHLGKNVAEGCKLFSQEAPISTPQEINLARRANSQRVDLTLTDFYNMYMQDSFITRHSGVGDSYRANLYSCLSVIKGSFPYATFETLQKLSAGAHGKAIRLVLKGSESFGENWHEKK